MDFLTAFPYWAIIAIIILNAWIVSKMNIQIDDEEAVKPTDNQPEDG